MAINAVPTNWKPSLKIRLACEIIVSPANVAAVAAKKKTHDETFLSAR